MTATRYDVHVAPVVIRRMSRVIGDTLHIWVGASLTELEQERYIQQRLDLYGLPRRRGLLTLLPVAGGHSAGHGTNTAAAIAVLGGSAVAAGVAAAVIIPAVVHGGGSAGHRPHAAAPAPRQPGRGGSPPPRVTPPPAHHGRPVYASSSTPAARSRPSTRSPRGLRGLRVLPVHAIVVSAGNPPGHTHVHVSPPTTPVSPPHLPLPTPRKAAPLLAVTVPPVDLSVRINPRLSVHLGVGAPP